MNEFEKSIKSYLDTKATEDSLFAKSYANEAKSIEKCCTYIITEVHKTKRQGFSDDEIYSLAIHYYDEDLTVGERPQCSVIVNHSIDLTEEEKHQARKDAIKKYQDDEIAKIKKKPIIKTETVTELSLF